MTPVSLTDPVQPGLFYKQSCDCDEAIDWFSSKILETLQTQMFLNIVVLAFDPLGRVSHRIAMSVLVWWCVLSPPNEFNFEASHWP